MCGRRTCRVGVLTNQPLPDRLDAQPVQRDDGDGVAQQLRLAKAGVVAGARRALVLGPDVLVARLVADERLQLLGSNLMVVDRLQ
jgi:hypothetical protein